MNSFLNYPAVKKLQRLAANPVDLRQILTPERIEDYKAKGCGFTFLYGTERVSDETLQALEELAQESQALEKMKKMQQGEIVNFIEGFKSENRPALHTATRDFFDHPQEAAKAKEAAELAKKEADKLRQFIAENEERFTDLLTVAIGGSDLGPRAHYFAMEHLLRPGKNIHFISNVDPDDAAGVLNKIKDLNTTLVMIVSKSGSTLETATNEALVRKRFEEAGLDPAKHFISITMPGTQMDQKGPYLETFYLWDWIGGRYSTTSMCGAVMLAFAFGFDVYWEFLQGAHCMDQNALQTDIKANLPLLAALLGIWNRNFLKLPTVALIPYSQALLRFPAHVQQLDMESNGKQVDKQGNKAEAPTGPIIWGEVGTNSQHSFFQLIHQGTDTIPVTFIGFKDSVYGSDVEFEGTTSQQKLLANLFAQCIALAGGQASDNPNEYFAGNRPTNILLAKALTPFQLGALLAFFEHKVAFQGFIWDINSFDQPGVQLGKVLANKIIDQFAGRHEDYPLGKAFLKQLEE
ncbi:MAG: glucose-6-phosphate isomerase [Parachlamydia sp.]|jgi:glucose-6-phosphate isomerase|nr:glucose-6-phosphate isomerase [Parachlamydia sp.]